MNVFSDVYYFIISNIKGRDFTATLHSTGADSIYFPKNGLEVLLMMKLIKEG